MLNFDRLPAPQRRALEIVREVAVEKGCKPYLVGGPVRDLLLGRSVSDLDLTLEEDSSVLARAVARRIDGRVRSFPQFLTYKIIADGFPEIDIASARKERYRKPGALPAVSAGRLKDDLLRRDFSINALAVDLNGTTLHDPANGRDDLTARVVRILHDQSFADDPTRIFRAIRLAERLGFWIEPHTLALMRASIDGGALGHVSRERLWRELFLAIDEPQAPEVLAKLDEQGALQLLLSRRRSRQGLIDRLKCAANAAEANSTLDRQVLFVGVLLEGDGSPVDLEGSGFSTRRARATMAIANELPRFVDAIQEAVDERKRFRLLRHAGPELLALLSRFHPQTGETINRFTDYQLFAIPVRGNDLEVPPGPHVARALERTREAVFLGEVPAESAPTFAREKALQYLSADSTAERK